MCDLCKGNHWLPTRNGGVNCPRCNHDGAKDCTYQWENPVPETARRRSHQVAIDRADYRHRFPNDCRPR